jgi:hypothetical protein
MFMHVGAEHKVVFDGQDSGEASSDGSHDYLQTILSSAIIQDCLARGNPRFVRIAKEPPGPTNDGTIFTKIAREQIATLRKWCMADACTGL